MHIQDGLVLVKGKKETVPLKSLLQISFMINHSMMDAILRVSTPDEGQHYHTAGIGTGMSTNNCKHKFTSSWRLMLAPFVRSNCTVPLKSLLQISFMINHSMMDAVLRVSTPDEGQHCHTAGIETGMSTDNCMHKLTSVWILMLAPFVRSNCTVSLCPF